MKKFVAGLVIGLLIATAGVGLAAGETVQATFAKFNFVVNGEAKTLEADPLVYQGTTYLPVRVVSNLLGYDVTYKADSRTIELISVGSENTEKGDENVEATYTATATKIKGRDLMDILERKYPGSSINLHADGYLQINDKEFNLEYFTLQSMLFFNAQPLINSGILSESDFQ